MDPRFEAFRTAFVAALKAEPPSLEVVLSGEKFGEWLFKYMTEAQLIGLSYLEDEIGGDAIDALITECFIEAGIRPDVVN